MLVFLNVSNLEENWHKAYNRLNSEQKLAVDTIDGPVMVVAGPGTGKTQILTLRIANILRQTDTEPDSILAITFTEAGAINMRQRLSEFIGSLAYRVKITTFHSFANDIIQNYGDFFPHIIGSTPIKDVEQVELLVKVILELDLSLLKTSGDTFYYLKSIKSAIDELKREGVSPKEFADLVDKSQANFDKIEDRFHPESSKYAGQMKGKYIEQQRKINKNKELIKVYEAYQAELRATKKYDFTDMLVELLEALKQSDELRLILQEQYQYVLVDEHQDSNNAQNKILENLMGYYDNPNFFVVGDEKQAIFRFQGASIANFYFFQRLYPQATLINLQSNYRSTQAILNLADSLLSGKVSLKAFSGELGKFAHIYEFSQIEQEMFFLASDIKEKVSNGVAPRDIAVLYRNNKDIFALTEYFDRLGVPYLIQSEQNILLKETAQKVITLWRGIAFFGDDECVAKMLHLDWFKLDPLDVFKLIRQSQQDRKHSLFEYLTNQGLRDSLELSSGDRLAEFVNNLLTWSARVGFTNARLLASEILRLSGAYQEIIAKNNQEDLEVIQGLFRLMNELSVSRPEFGLRDFLGYLDLMNEHGVSIKSGGIKGKNLVNCMTAHKSKGLEFEYVYVMQATASSFGSSSHRKLLPIIEEVYDLYDQVGADAESSLADERRLFYVALTRAKKQVFISYALTDNQGREQSPTPFLQEVDSSFLEYMDTSSILERFESQHRLLMAPPDSASVIRLTDKEFLRVLFLKNGLSVSALNNYLRSPWEYFYKNLLRIPTPPNKHQAYGSAIHQALQDFFDFYRRRGEIPTEDWLLQSFSQSLDNQAHLSLADYEEAKTKGFSSLSVWYKENKNQAIRDCLTELRVNEANLTDDIRLVGVIDKLEFLEDGSVRVVDYKTGKFKTRNNILGKTKDSDGDYYRQLVFYKLLLRYYKGGSYQVSKAKLSFVEPDDKGRLREEEFEIADSEVDELAELIKKVADEIMNLSFWDTECDPSKCEYCDLVKAIKDGYNSIPNIEL